MRILPVLLALLAMFAAAGAVFEFRQALSLWHTDRAFALTVLAVMLVVAGVRLRLCTGSHVSPARFTVRSAVSTFLIFVASLLTVRIGCGTLFETVELCNQEYLHWLPENQPKVFPVSTGLAIAIFAAVGTLSLAVGLFMFWFLFFRRFVVPAVGSNTESLNSDSNPYTAPQQSG